MSDDQKTPPQPFARKPVTWGRMPATTFHVGPVPVAPNPLDRIPNPPRKAPPPQPDVLLDTTRGWSVETLDRWKASHPRRRQRITDAQREAMTNDLRAGRSIAEVAQAHQVSRPVVNKLDLARRAAEGK